MNNENPTQGREDAENAKGLEDNEKRHMPVISNAVDISLRSLRLRASALDFMTLWFGGEEQPVPPNVNQ